MRSSQTISSQLRNEILKARLTRYRISKDTGVAASMLSRFINAKNGLDLATVDRLCTYFALELRHIKPRKGR